MSEYINQLSVEERTGEREMPKMKLTNFQRLQLNRAYDTLTRLKILGCDIENQDIVDAADNLQELIDEV